MIFDIVYSLSVHLGFQLKSNGDDLNPKDTSYILSVFTRFNESKVIYELRSHYLYVDLIL